MKRLGKQFSIFFEIFWYQIFDLCRLLRYNRVANDVKSVYDLTTLFDLYRDRGIDVKRWNGRRFFQCSHFSQFLRTSENVATYSPIKHPNYPFRVQSPNRDKFPNCARAFPPFPRKNRGY